MIRTSSNIALRALYAALTLLVMGAPVLGTLQTGPPPPKETENKPRIGKILFEGTEAFSSKDLARRISTKTAFWFIRSGAFEQEQVEGDVARLQKFFSDAGFLEARANFATSLSQNGLDMTLTFTIAAGERYAIEAVQFEGNLTLSAGELLALISSTEGDTVKPPTIDADVRAIQERYHELGFLDSIVRSTRAFSDVKGLVRITYRIHEGERFKIGRIAVRGNTRTKDKVVRRELNLYPPDDWFDLNEAHAAEKRLRGTKIFTDAWVSSEVGDSPGTRNAIINVTEADNVRNIFFQLGLNSRLGLGGIVRLELNNFDLSNPPRDWSELWSRRAFLGGGQRLNISLEPGTRQSQFRIDFTEPYLFDRPTRFDASLYAFGSQRDGYRVTRNGLVVSVSKRLDAGRLRGWTQELAFRGESVGVDDVELFSSRRIRDDRGDSLLLSVKASVARDRRDNAVVSTDGDRLRLSVEQFVGDFNFAKVSFGYDWYKTLRADRMDRKHVLHLRASGGALLGDSPVFERFFAGGIGSLRGFVRRSVGEHDGLDDNNVGGDFMLLFGAEYSYPLFGKLRGRVFLDTGAVGSGPMRAAIGTGVNFSLPTPFGLIPIELNLAAPISSDADDDEKVLSFRFGGFF